MRTRDLLNSKLLAASRMFSLPIPPDKSAGVNIVDPNSRATEHEREGELVSIKRILASKVVLMCQVQCLLDGKTFTGSGRERLSRWEVLLSEMPTGFENGKVAESLVLNLWCEPGSCSSGLFFPSLQLPAWEEDSTVSLIS